MTGVQTCALPITMTADNYGWFWCAGVCPDAATLGGANALSAETVLVGTDVTAGAAFEFTVDQNITVATNDATITKMGYSLALMVHPVDRKSVV